MKFKHTRHGSENPSKHWRHFGDPMYPWLYPLQGVRILKAHVISVQQMDSYSRLLAIGFVSSSHMVIRLVYQILLGHFFYTNPPRMVDFHRGQCLRYRKPSFPPVNWNYTNFHRVIADSSLHSVATDGAFRSIRIEETFFLEWSSLGGGFLNNFHPIPGEMIQPDEHIFQMGWNHQLVQPADMSFVFSKNTIGFRSSTPLDFQSIQNLLVHA